MTNTTTDAGATPAFAELLPKILNDPYYGSAYTELGSLEAVFDAGFFDDGVERIARADSDWMSTPLHKVSRRLASRAAEDMRPVVVLLMTGSFNPVHRGHVESLEIARLELEQRGYFVAGGYLSPSHDSYVSAKLGHKALPAPARLELCNIATADSDWLMASGWEAIGVDRAVNFTDVIIWLEAYLARHIKHAPPVRVAYVFSSDHAAFARTFVSQGMCVCTVRPDFPVNLADCAEDPAVRSNPNIIFTDREKMLSSSYMIVNQERFDLMDARSRRRYIKMIAERCGISVIDRAPGVYVLRDECGWEVEPWLARRNRDQVYRARQELLNKLALLISVAHRRSGSEVVFHFQVLDKQRKLIERQRRKRTLSLDPLIDGAVNLAVSRHFPLACPHVKPSLSHRPGSKPLDEQIAEIPPGEYVLVDDDVATGATLKAIKAMLPEGVRIVRDFILLEQDPNAPKSRLDVLDCRDFIAGSRQGGLVVSLPDDTLARVPYALPYASPADRASIPLMEELAFSRDIWRINEEFFDSIEPPIVLGEADQAFQRLMTHLGFGQSTPMSEICRWHAERSSLDVERTVVYRRKADE